MGELQDGVVVVDPEGLAFHAPILLAGLVNGIGYVNRNSGAELLYSWLRRKWLSERQGDIATFTYVSGVVSKL